MLFFDTPPRWSSPLQKPGQSRTCAAGTKGQGKVAVKKHTLTTPAFHDKICHNYILTICVYLEIISDQILTNNVLFSGHYL